MGKLTALGVARITKPGTYADGDGLYLQVVNGNARSWIYRYSLDGRARYYGLGSAKVISLRRARELAAEPRRLRAEGIDPLEHRRAQRQAARIQSVRGVTFRQCAEGYIAAHEHSWTNAAHREQWRTSLAMYVFPVVGDMPLQAIDTALVLRILQPIWNAKPETASRIRSRIKSILDAAKAQDLRTGENPARWKGHLANLLPAPAKVRKVEHHPALLYGELPAFMADLRGRPSISARCLEFTVLTAARRGEAIGARWSEIDLDAAVWTVPATRMKSRRAHRVPLAEPVIRLLRDLHAVRSSEHVFPGNKPDKPLTGSSVNKLLEMMDRRDITVHGFRSTFRDWAAEQTEFSYEVVEMALAHAVGSSVERAYRRTDLFEKRAKLMTAWAGYCASAQ